jgi:hypothetical protein
MDWKTHCRRLRKNLAIGAIDWFDYQYGLMITLQKAGRGKKVSRHRAMTLAETYKIARGLRDQINTLLPV